MHSSAPAVIHRLEQCNQQSWPRSEIGAMAERLEGKIHGAGKNQVRQMEALYGRAGAVTQISLPTERSGRFWSTVLS